jgi:DNA polymerase epsilon subunit 1
VNPRVSAPGCYAGVCVELDVIGMAVNTVLEAPHILQEIGATGALTFDGVEERPLDSAHAARAAFASLRKLVTRWSVEVAHSGDVLEPLLANFYRWIADTHSLAYDPALHRMLHSLMERVFWRLVERFRKADLQVVYADFNRMIVATKTPRLELAQHRVRTLLDAIKQDNLFAWLDLAPAASGESYGSAWSTLIFHDAANYCGVPATALATAPENLQPHAQWNIAAHLPATVSERFVAVLSSYAVDVEKRRRRATSAAGSSAAQVVAQANAESAAAAASARAMSIDKPHEGGDVLGEGDTLLHDAQFRTLLLRFVSDASSDASTADKIEFVKAMCAMLALDADVREAVHLLKQMLLRPLGVTAFAPRAAFADPCRSLTLPDVVCAYCFDQRDFDLLRDPAAATGVLECARCQHAYSRVALEARLVALLQRRAVAYQLQDVRCTSCRLVAADVMRATCRACSKPLELKTSAADSRDGIEVFGVVAKHHKFEWLANEVETLL